MSAVPGWRQLLEQAMQQHAHLPHARFVQLATLRTDGRPANRTLVFRDWLEGEDRLLFTTDLRSAKVSQLEASPWAELCWYFGETREQFRILSQVSIGTHVTGGELAAARARCWHEASDATRQSFTWPPPGEVRAAPSTFDEPPSVEPPPDFGILILVPAEVEYLDLRVRPHLRRVYRRVANAWTDVVVNP
jgi:pyridoxamine 5'-phosphate oxidase